MHIDFVRCARLDFAAHKLHCARTLEVLERSLRTLPSRNRRNTVHSWKSRRTRVLNEVISFDSCASDGPHFCAFMFATSRVIHRVIPRSAIVSRSRILTIHHRTTRCRGSAKTSAKITWIESVVARRPACNYTLTHRTDERTNVSAKARPESSRFTIVPRVIPDRKFWFNFCAYSAFGRGTANESSRTGPQTTRKGWQ